MKICSQHQKKCYELILVTYELIWTCLSFYMYPLIHSGVPVIQKWQTTPFKNVFLVQHILFWLFFTIWVQRIESGFGELLHSCYFNRFFSIYVPMFISLFTLFTPWCYIWVCWTANRSLSTLFDILILKAFFYHGCFFLNYNQKVKLTTFNLIYHDLS